MVGSEPRQEEVLTVVRIDDSKVALKTGFGKYVGLTPSGELVARADAVGPREYWEPVFQEVRVSDYHYILRVTSRKVLRYISLNVPLMP